MKKNRGSSRSSSSSSSESSSSSSSESSSRSKKEKPISRKHEEIKSTDKEVIQADQKESFHEQPITNNTPLRMAVTNLTKNINEDHIREIFSNYGTIKTITLNNRKSFIEYEKLEEYELAHKCMNKGQIDGKIVRVDLIFEEEKTTEKINVKQNEKVSTRKKQRSPGTRKYDKSPRRKYSSSKSSRNSRSNRKK